MSSICDVCIAGPCPIGILKTALWLPTRRDIDVSDHRMTRRTANLKAALARQVANERSRPRRIVAVLSLSRKAAAPLFCKAALGSEWRKPAQVRGTASADPRALGDATESRQSLPISSILQACVLRHCSDDRHEHASCIRV